MVSSRKEAHQGTTLHNLKIASAKGVTPLNPSSSIVSEVARRADNPILYYLNKSRDLIRKLKELESFMGKQEEEEHIYNS